MAARIIQELTSDEVKRHNGLKFGDFGTGGVERCLCVEQLALLNAS